MSWSVSASIVIDVPFVNEGDRAAHGRFGGNMPDHHPICPSGEPAVRDQPDGITQPGPNQRRCRGKHLPHPRPPLRSFVPDHRSRRRARISPARIALRQTSSESKTRAGPVIFGVLHAGNLGHRTFGRKVPAQDREVACG